MPAALLGFDSCAFSPGVTSADAGTYCAQVFDPGSLSADTQFSLVIEYP